MKRFRPSWLMRMNLISRIAFLLLTPLLFRALNFAFVYHAIYWGAVTLVVLVWGGAIAISPLLGRIGCGWMCFMGTIQDFSSEQSLIRIGWHKPLRWLQLACLLGFFGSSVAFLVLRLRAGVVHGITFNPMLLSMGLEGHYKAVWLYDAFGAVLLGLFQERRWACRNVCFMGLLCASGASVSRLIPVVDPKSCNLCGICEDVCPVRIPIRDYVKRGGLVTNAECLLCGKCTAACPKKSMGIRFVWNRKRALAAA